MESWTVTLRLIALMAVIAVFYLLGRWAAEAVQGFAARGGLPSL